MPTASSPTKSSRAGEPTLADTLRVRRVDSPLRRGDSASTVRSAKPRPKQAPRRGEGADNPTNDVETSDGVAHAAPGDTGAVLVSRAHAPVDPAEPGPAIAYAPPPLEERRELISARLPESLARRPAQMAAKLRQRGLGASQKALPTQDLIAVALWATMGDPDDPEALDAFERLLLEYRGRQYAEAGSRLHPSA